MIRKAVVEYQGLKENKQNLLKKSSENLHVIRKIVVPLQRFNKQLIVLHVLKTQKEMKKLAFLFAAVVAVSFASCGQKTEQGSCCDSDSVCVEEAVCVDTCACDTCACDTCTCACPAAE